MGFFLCLTGLWVSWAPAVFAQAKYPVRPIRALIPFPARRRWSSCDRTAGQPDHLSAEFFQRLAGIQMTHVPYKGGGPALVDLVAGDL